MKIIIPTCNAYRNVLEANKYTMDKFNGAALDVIVLGYKKPDFDMGNWKFISLGTDTGAQNFTNDIWKFFENFDEDFFIYGNDDIVVVDYLDLDLLNDMENIIKSDKNVMKICVTSAPTKNYKNPIIYKNNGNFKYIQLQPDADYRLSLHYGIWRTSYFKKYFKLGLSPWDWELRDSAKNDGAIILGTSGRYFLDFGHILRRGGRITNNWHFSEYTRKILPQKDIDFVINVLNKMTNDELLA